MTPWPQPVRRAAATTQDMHVVLWNLSLPRRRIKVNSSLMAEELECTPIAVKKWMSRLVKEGRIRVVGRGVGLVPTYLVADPDVYQDHGPPGRASSWG